MSVFGLFLTCWSTWPFLQKCQFVLISIAFWYVVISGRTSNLALLTLLPSSNSSLNFKHFIFHMNFRINLTNTLRKLLWLHRLMWGQLIYLLDWVILTQSWIWYISYLSRSCFKTFSKVLVFSSPTHVRFLLVLLLGSLLFLLLLWIEYFLYILYFLIGHCDSIIKLLNCACV